MIIKALKTFSDGVISMHEGEIANVPDLKAQHFIAEGYAVEYTGEGGVDLSDYAKKTDLNEFVKSEDVEPIAYNVAKNIEGLEEVPAFETLDITIENKYLNKTTGTWVPDGNSYSTVIEVQEGEVYRITGKYQYLVALYGLYNTNGTKLNLYPTGGSVATRTEETVVVEIPQGATELRVTSYTSRPIVEKKKAINSLKVSHKSNVLYGKKWAVCGDSFTAGDFSGYTDSEGKTGTNSDAYDQTQRHYKTYPWWIGNRNEMSVQWLAIGGADFTNIEGATGAFSNSESTINYTQIANDCDYITLMYGLNESGLTNEQIGTNTDNDNTTLWGAYNVVLESILTANPTVKIGIIISDAWLSQTYHDALIDIAKYWGIPYLDLRNGEQVPMMITGRLDTVSNTAKTLRDNAFKVSATNSHPNVKAHEYRSTVIENFLRSL